MNHIITIGQMLILQMRFLNASPQKLIMKIYDFAITQCRNKNLEKTNKALAELINALRFDGEEVSEISTGLRKLYEFCQDQMRKKNYDISLTDINRPT